MRGKYQGGSLAGFVIVGILLALVLVGGLYGLNRYNAQKASETTSNESNKKDEQSSSSDKTETKSNDTSSSPSGDTSESRSTDSSSRTSSSDDTTDSSSTGETDSTTDDSTAATSANLPQTGPADALTSLIAVTALGFAAAHYVRSRARA